MSARRPKTMGQVLQSFASAIQDERKRGLPRFSEEQIARIEAVVDHMAPTSSASLAQKRRRPAADERAPQHDTPRTQRAARAAAAPSSATPRASTASIATPSLKETPAKTAARTPAAASSSERSPRVSSPSAATQAASGDQRMPWMVDESASATRAPTTPPSSSRASASVRSESSAPTQLVAASEDAASALHAIRAELVDCTRCGLCQTRTHIVFGNGNPNARLMLIGEAPSATDDRNGTPFSDEAGALLDNMLRAMTLDRKDVYCTTVLKCHPPNNRAAQREELVNCAPFLRQQIEAIQPEVILTLGSQASRLLLGGRFPFAQNRGEWSEWESIPVMPTWHPGYLLQHPREKASAWRDLQSVMQKLGLS